MVRIGGLASGMDIDTLVSDLMKAERIPLDKLTQKKQILEWQRDDYREMNTLLSDLDDFIYENMTLQKDFLKKEVVSSDSSVVTAAATTDAAQTTTSISVRQMAKSATWTSANGNSISGFPTTTDSEIELKVTNGDGKTSDIIKINIKAGSTVNDVVTQLSNKKELGISAFYDTQQGKVVITKNDTGSKSKVSMVDDDATALFTSLGFDFNTTGTDKSLTIGDGRPGADAKFSINGYETERSSNTFTMNNVTYTLQKEGTTGSPATSNITISNDSDNMVDKIVQFVNKYNEMIEKIDGKIGEERYRTYQPLSDEEKEGMSEKQIELWEEKAKSGHLRNDSVLSGALTQLRMNFYTPLSGTGVNSDFSQLAQLGIKTTNNYSERGKLSIDEEVLREAVGKDPNAVFQLFSGGGTSKDTPTEELGIAKRIRETISATIQSIEKKAGKASYTNQQFSIGRNVIQIGSQIDRFEDRLLKVENRYWREFTAMEKAIQKANSQSAFIMQQFSM